MPKTKAAKTYQRKYRKEHPEYDQNYKDKHWVLRITFTVVERDRLQKAFGDDLHQIARRLIRVEMLKRELSVPENNHFPTSQPV